MSIIISRQTRRFHLIRLSTKPTLELVSGPGLIVVVCFPPYCLIVVVEVWPCVAVPGLEDLVAVPGLELGLVVPAVLGLVVVPVFAVGLAVLGLGLEGLALPLGLEGPAGGAKIVSKKFSSSQIFPTCWGPAIVVVWLPGWLHCRFWRRSLKHFCLQSPKQWQC